MQAGHCQQVHLVVPVRTGVLPSPLPPSRTLAPLYPVIMSNRERNVYVIYLNKPFVIVIFINIKSYYSSVHLVCNKIL